MGRGNKTACATAERLSAYLVGLVAVGARRIEHSLSKDFGVGWSSHCVFSQRTECDTD